MYRRAPTLAPCWCRCICHTPMADLSAHYGPLICAKPNRAGRCGDCRKDCYESRPQDRPNDRPNRR